MLRGYRCIVIAAVGWLIVAASPPDNRTGTENQRPANSAQQALGDIAASLKKANEAVKPDTGCTKGQDERQSDLCAQWKAADAAEESANWTRRTFYLTIGGLIVGAFTLAAAAFAAWYARNAAREGKRSADAAETAVVEARRIGEAQTRCYVSIVSARVKLRANVPVIQIEVRNSGQSPALSLVASYGFAPDSTGVKFGNIDLIEHEAVEYIPAQDTVWLPVWHPPKLLSAQQVRHWRDGSAGVVVLEVMLKGEDVFGEPVEERQYFLCPCTGFEDGKFYPMGTLNALKADAKAKILQMEFEDFPEEIAQARQKL